MPPRPLFNSTEQAIEVLWFVTIKLSGLLTWMALLLAHTVLLALMLLALWAFQTTPADVAAAGRQMLQTWPAAALGAVGVSAASVGAAYWWLMKRLHRAAGGALAQLLLPPPTY